MATLGGTTFVYRAVDFDYHIVETVNCLKEFCDKVVVVVVESQDGTMELVKPLEDEKTKVVICPIDKWHEIKGREKLSYFQNVASEHLDTDYNFLLQSDEIVHEDSYTAIRRAVETGAEGYLVTRIHLWGNPNLRIDVPIYRMPAGIHIGRLAKSHLRSYDDGENLYIQNPSLQFLDEIRIYHMGFVRSREKMVDKCVHIQRDVFLIDPDKRLEGMTTFEPNRWFAPEDLKPIEEPLPAIIQQWADERTYKD